MPTSRPVFDVRAGAAAGGGTRARAREEGEASARRAAAGAAAGDTTVAGAAEFEVTTPPAGSGCALRVGGAAGTFSPGAVATSAWRSVGVEPGRVRASEVVRHLATGLVARVRRLGQRLGEDAHDLVGDGRVQLADRRRLLRDDLEDEAGDGVAAERLLAREHLVEHGAHREQVAAPVQGRAPRLLRAHVGRRAQQAARHGEVIRRSPSPWRCRSPSPSRGRPPRP